MNPRLTENGRFPQQVKEVGCVIHISRFSYDQVLIDCPVAHFHLIEDSEPVVVKDGLVSTTRSKIHVVGLYSFV